MSAETPEAEQDRVEPPPVSGGAGLESPQRNALGGPATFLTRPVGCWTPLAIAVLGGTVLIAAVIGLVVGRFSAPEAAETTSVRNTASVVTAVRDLARLESAQYHVERVIDLSDSQRRLFGLVETKDAILLVAAGDVSAGVDLSQIAQSDIDADAAAGRVRIALPSAQILSSRLDNQRTYVHSRQTDLLAERRDSLESRARQHAEESIVKAALESGILDRAEKNAVRTVETLLRSLGYTEVEVQIHSRVQQD